MFRVREQIGCNRVPSAQDGKGVAVAVLDTGERVIIMSS